MKSLFLVSIQSLDHYFTTTHNPFGLVAFTLKLVRATTFSLDIALHNTTVIPQMIKLYNFLAILHWRDNINYKSLSYLNNIRIWVI